MQQGGGLFELAGWRYLAAVKPILLPALERLARRGLARRGITGRHIRTPHATLHVYDARGRGTLPPVVLLHGIGSAATGFAGVMGRLVHEVERIVAPDYPGHGFSGEASVPLTPDALFRMIDNALDDLLDRPALLVGNSLGGAVALTFAIRRPERVRGLVLVSPAGGRVSDAEWAAIRRAFALRTRAEARAFVERLYHRPPRLSPLLSLELPALMQRRAVQELLATASNDHLPSPEQLGALTAPILLVWGKSERILPASLLEYFRRHLPAHTIVEQPDDFGHCPQFETPGRLARRIADFGHSL
jgi:pimeloyl-ACP methyl ester carboxylesterase